MPARTGSKRRCGCSPFPVWALALCAMALRFRNLAGDAHIAGFGDVLRWQLGLHDEKQPRTARRGVVVPAVDNDGRALRQAGQDSLTWIGHASFLVRLGGKSALIDPVLSHSLGPGLARNVAPGLRAGALPSIDLVLITRNHRDHMDETDAARSSDRSPPTWCPGGSRVGSPSAASPRSWRWIGGRRNRWPASR